MQRRREAQEAAKAAQRRQGKKAGLLSFDEPTSDAENEDAALLQPAKRARMLSAHDAANDARCVLMRAVGRLQEGSLLAHRLAQQATMLMICVWMVSKAAGSGSVCLGCSCARVLAFGKA